uniref:Uncharacterized protein n=1 Tax=Aegilops tauschii TaxID=37682 RepID=M8BZ67_AEGTA
MVRQAGRLLGQLLVMGSAVVGRAVVQAYRQTIVRYAGRSALVQGKISTMTVKDNLLVAGGFHGELICNVRRPEYPTADPYPDQLRRRFSRLRPHSPVCAVEPGLLTSFLMVARRESPLLAVTQPCLVPYKGRRRRMLSPSVPNAAELSSISQLASLEQLGVLHDGVNYENAKCEKIRPTVHFLPECII